MTKREYCQSHESIAYYSGLHGLEIKGIDYGVDDYVYCVSGAWGNPRLQGFHRVKVNYTRGGRAYIRVNGWTVYLDECIRMGA